MTIYVQGQTALDFYRAGRFATDVEQVTQAARRLEDATSSYGEICQLAFWRLGIPEPTKTRPAEVLVPTRVSRIRNQSTRPRVWNSSLPLPRTALRKLNDSLYVSSPEFVFLQMATRLNLPELIALGMELCGTYRRFVEVGSIDSGHTGFMTVYNQPPLTSVKRLRGFFNSIPSAPGRTKALDALKIVIPNSASPMESSLYMLLCLPRRLGGYALPSPVLNPPIVLSKAGRQFTLRRTAKPDLFWRQAHLDLEYDSDEFHEETRAADSMRRKALERMKVEVVGMTTDELFSAPLFHATAKRLARRLGKRLRPESDDDFVSRRALLRDCLLYDISTRPTISDGYEDANASRVGSDEPFFDQYGEPTQSAIWGDTPTLDSMSWDEGAWEGEELALDDSWSVELKAEDWSSLTSFGDGSYKQKRG